MKVIELIKQLFNRDTFRDAIPDPRPYKEQEKDYIYGEDVLIESPLPPGKRITSLPIIPQDQQRTGACGAFTAAHARETLEGGITEPLTWYRSRSNYPRAGMFVKEAIELAAFASSTPKVDRPKTLTEFFANSLPLIDVFNNSRKETYEYVRIKPYDVGGVLDAVQSGHATMISFFSTYNEWSFEMEVTDFTTQFTAPVRHFVLAIPNSYHIHNGKGWISVVDSAPNQGHFLRHISIDFLKERMMLGGGFYYHLSPQPKKKKTVVLPTNRCHYGQRSSDVLVLQKFLLSEGLMVERHMTSYYGNITSRAVLKWQLDNIVTTPAPILRAWGGRYWGPRSIKSVLKQKNG